MLRYFAQLIACLILLGAALQPARAQSLYADPKASQPGDVVTVVLAERTAAEQRSSYDKASRSSAVANATHESGNLSGKFGLDAEFGMDTKDRNSAVQSDLLQGYITAVVVQRDSTGNLVIRGERKINVNGITHRMKVAGTVRPRDIRYNNTIYSYQIANAQVEYSRAGFARKFFKPGFLSKVGLAVIVGAVIHSRISHND